MKPEPCQLDIAAEHNHHGGPITGFYGGQESRPFFLFCRGPFVMGTPPALAQVGRAADPRGDLWQVLSFVATYPLSHLPPLLSVGEMEISDNWHFVRAGNVNPAQGEVDFQDVTKAIKKTL
jgi:hypothetical protein